MLYVMEEPLRLTVFYTAAAAAAAAATVVEAIIYYYTHFLVEPLWFFHKMRKCV